MNVQAVATPEGARLSVRVAFPTLVALRAPIGIFVATRLVVLVLGYAGAILVPTNPSSRLYLALSSWLDSHFGGMAGVWAHWDAFNYLTVAQDGYWFDPVAGKGSPLVSPVFPSIVHFLLGGGAVGGLIVSNLAFLLGLVALYHLLDTTKRLGYLTERACLLLALPPYAFLLVAPYALSLALFFGVFAFYFDEHDQSWLAMLAATLATLTQPAAIAVWLALIVRRLVCRPAGFTEQLSIAASALLLPVSATGVILYLQKEVSFPPREAAVIVLGIEHSPLTVWRDALGGSSSDHLLLAFNLALGLLALTTLPRVIKLLSPAYAAYVVAVVTWGLLINPGEIGSYLLLAFPVYVAAADYLVNELTQILAVTTSVFSLAVLTALFVTWYPIGGSSSIIEASSANDLILAAFHSRLLHAHTHEARPHELLLTLEDSVLFLADMQPKARYAPGDDLTIPLYMYVLNPPEHGYLLSARLTDASGQRRLKSDKVLWSTADTSIDGTSTSRLVEGNYVQDTLNLKIDPGLPPGIYSLDVLAFGIPSYNRLSLTASDGNSLSRIDHFEVVIADAQDLGTTASLVPSHHLRADSNDGISLWGDDVHVGGDSTDLQVSLYWLARSRPSRDYTVFVQLLDNSGKVVAQSDSYPLAGHFPTSQLQPGDVLRDTHDLTIPSDSATGNDKLIVGMYRLDTMQRLTFIPESGGRAVDHLELGTISPSALH